jgi:heavy metal translocating P-type ATPase
MRSTMVRKASWAWLAASIIGLTIGGFSWLASHHAAADVFWAAVAALALVPLVVFVALSLLRREPGVDVIALLALVGSLALAEYLAGAVIAVMLTGGRVLEQSASARARRSLSALLEQAPTVVHRQEAGQLTSPPIESVQPGDLLLVKPGERVPVDGTVVEVPAVLDESALTGESVLVERQVGEPVRSGAVNAGGPIDLRATTTADESTYAGIVRLVSEAEKDKAPFVRLANRYALVFLPATLVIAGVAWAASGQAVRALAVLVVATPCPLILAAPVAIVSGIARAASGGVILKGGGALETLGRVRVLLFDKTGTLTSGHPRVTSVETPGDAAELLRLAASLDQVSPHVLASAVVRAASERKVELDRPSEVIEDPGQGVRGRVGGHLVAVGRADWVAPTVRLPEWARRVRQRASYAGEATIFVAVDDCLAGVLVVADPIRADSPRTLRALRNEGIERIVMVTGDHSSVADTVGAALGVDTVLADRAPAEKVEAVREERSRATTAMVGDGVNDAPALAVADVGVALGARGSTASSEAADVVIVPDRLDRLVDGLATARRSRRIALQSVIVGMGLSLIAMLIATSGVLAPVVGAVTQEVIDVVVILNALRALGGRARPPVGTEAVALGQRLRSEHSELISVVDQ